MTAPLAIRDGWITGGGMLIEGSLRHDCALRVENGRIAAITPADDADDDAFRLRPDQLLLPGLLDVQVNGGGGVMFNQTPERLADIVAAHQALGVSAIMPTLITDAPPMIERAVQAVLDHPGSSVLGLHLEGPFLSPRRPGIHDARLIRRMNPADAAQLLAIARRLAPRKLLVTLAPEEVEDAHLAMLAGAGVVMAIGHSMTSYERAIQALGLGVRGFTHLWNAMPGPTARAPGPVVAALEQGYAGLIADLIHVDVANLRLTLAAKAPGSVFLVSDAMALVGTEATEMRLQGRRILRQGGRLMGEDGTLAGAAGEQTA